MSASNIDSPESDPRLAFQIMLARMDRILKSHAKNREMMPQFKSDWALLERTRVRFDRSNRNATATASDLATSPTATRGAQH